MKITVKELRQVISEAFTQHQIDISNKMLEAAQRAAGRWAHYVKFGDGDKKNLMSNLAAVAQETKGWAASFGRHYPQTADRVNRIHAILVELDKDANSLFSGFLSKKQVNSAKAQKIQALSDELAKLCESLGAPRYTEDYGNRDEDHLQLRSNDTVTLKK